MFYVYILQSLKDGSSYVGQTNNVPNRLERHNSWRQSATRSKVPWELVYTEPFDTRSQAVRRELEIKSWKSHRAIKELLNNSNGA
jgi:putative endonuclease